MSNFHCGDIVETIADVGIIDNAAVQGVSLEIDKRIFFTTETVQPSSVTLSN